MLVVKTAFYIYIIIQTFESITLYTYIGGHLILTSHDIIKQQIITAAKTVARGILILILTMFVLRAAAVCLCTHVLFCCTANATLLCCNMSATINQVTFLFGTVLTRLNEPKLTREGFGG